ncbi:MAG TPA: S8 family serine peptidase [Bdellovibrionota bacterium]|nr:S8 family serine peptidase [Bdellovibrionota bacterium]
MKLHKWIASTISIVFVAFLLTSHAVSSSRNVFFVTLKNQFDLNRTLSKLGQVKIKPLLNGAILEVEVIEGNVDEMIEALKNHPSITNVVPNFELPIKHQEGENIELRYDQVFPETDYMWWKKNDGGYHVQFYDFNKITKEKKLTFDIPSKMGADINLENAHRIETGNPEVVVAVIDTGIDLTHPALANSVYTNVLEIPGNNTDDDGNGYVDDIHGWNFGTDSGDVSDTRGHGTVLSGIIAGNGDGFEGVCPGCKILPIVIENMFDGFVESADYMAKQNVKVVNMSLAWDIDKMKGDEESNRAFFRFIEYIIEILHDQGMVIVAAAGNSGDKGNPISYPAFFDETIAVGGSDPWDIYTAFSNYGPWVDIVAPALNIWTTQPVGIINPRNGKSFDSSTKKPGYGYFSGTSVAAPMVAGAAALLLSHYPRMTAHEVKQTLLHPNNTQHIEAFFPRPATKRLDIFKALKNPIFDVPDMPDEEEDEIDPANLVWH